MNNAENNQSIERDYIHSMVTDIVSEDNGGLPLENTQILESEKKVLEAKQAEAKQAEAKQAEAKQAEAKQAEAKQVEAKEVEAKEVEAKEVEAKEVEAKEAEAKEAEAKEAEAKEAEAKEAEAKEAETKAKPAEAKEEVLNCYSDIECRVVQIAGLNFALPETNIKQLVDEQEIVFEKTGYVDSGNVCINGVFVDVIDVSRIINKSSDEVMAAKKVNVLLLKQSHTGIVYDKEIGVEKVSLSDVCWRSDDSNNTWLAGTVLKLGFSLLDPVGILKLLTEKG